MGREGPGKTVSLCPFQWVVSRWVFKKRADCSPSKLSVARWSLGRGSEWVLVEGWVSRDLGEQGGFSTDWQWEVREKERGGSSAHLGLTWGEYIQGSLGGLGARGVVQASQGLGAGAGLGVSVRDPTSLGCPLQNPHRRQTLQVPASWL